MSEGNVLRPVELSPSEAALAYIMVRDGVIPGSRVRDAARLLEKVEAAMVEVTEAVVEGDG